LSFQDRIKIFLPKGWKDWWWNEILDIS